ncbi:MAG: hypothetical protein AAGD11_07395 [Planctomycetota bacterium]
MTKPSNAKSGRSAGILLKITAILWVIWGLVHVLAGVMTISRDTAQAVQGIADAVERESLEVPYPEAAGAIIKQHGFNLLWIGAVTTICAVFIWRQSTTAIFLAAMIAGLADIGYFLFLDLGGYVNFLPGTAMTLICAAAVVISFFAYFIRREKTI